MSYGQILEEAVASGAVPAAAIAVATTDGVQEIASAGGHGDDTVWRYASCTKAIASVGLLRLIEQGKATLDTEVREVIPSFGDLQVLEGFNGDEPILRAPKTQATLRQLLTHTSGLTYFFANENMLKYHEVAGTPHVLSGLEAALHNPLIADPGTIWEYGVSLDWVGLVAQELSGQRFDEYLYEHVTGPLGLTSMTFQPTPEQREKMIPVHHRAPDGSLVAGELDLPPEPEFFAGGHGLHGTAGDYGRFISAILRGGELDGERVLAQETVDLMFTPAIGDIQLPEMIKSSAPELSNDIPSLPLPQSWGTGFHLTLADIPTMRSAGTGDWAGLFNLYYWVDRKAGVGGIFCTQVLPFFDQQVVGAAVAFEQAVYTQIGAAAA